MSIRIFTIQDYLACSVYAQIFSPQHQYSIVRSAGHLANAATELMKLDHEEPQLTEPYLSKQKKLMVSLMCSLIGFKMR